MTKCPFMFLLIMHFSFVLSVKKKERKFLTCVDYVCCKLQVLTESEEYSCSAFPDLYLGFPKTSEHWHWLWFKDVISFILIEFLYFSCIVHICDPPNDLGPQIPPYPSFVEPFFLSVSSFCPVICPFFAPVS